MDNPVTVIKTSLSPGKILAWAIVGLAVFALADLAGVTDWILYPVSSAKAKFGKTAAS